MMVDEKSLKGSHDLSKLASSSNPEEDVKELYNNWAKNYDKVSVVRIINKPCRLIRSQASLISSKEFL